MKRASIFFIVILAISQTSFACQPASYLYAHGIAHHKEQAFWYLKKTPHGIENKHYLIDGRLFTFDFPDATRRFWRINFFNTSLGQANELTSLYQAYSQSLKTLIQENESTNLVFLGLSRGAAAGITFLGLFKTPYIKAAVFESPFDTHAHLVDGILKKMHLDSIPGMQTVGSWLMQAAFMQHKKDGICPLDAVSSIQKDMPILLVCSKEDTTVPYQSTVELYKKLKESGHEHVYILILNTGKHSKLLSDILGELYQNTVHAFYKKYNLPHNPLFAAKGQKSLECCQPPIETLAKE